MDTRTTVALAHAQTMVREGLRRVLEETGGIRVVGEAGSGSMAVRLARQKEPEIMLVDAAIRETGVIRVIRALATRGLKTRVVVLTTPKDEEFLERIIESGAMGSIGTHRTARRLAMVVEMVAAGRTCFPPRASRLVQRRVPNNGTGLEGRLAELNEKERDIVALTAQGHTSMEIGRRLSMTASARVVNTTGVKLKTPTKGRLTASVCCACWSRMRQPGSSGLRSKLIYLVLFVVTAACVQQDDTGLSARIPFLERDSAGVLMATTWGARARTPIGWVVDTVPEYQIGEMDGEEPYLFSRIAGARRLLDGRVVVLDRESCELRFFDEEGGFLERTGGRGEGPGEFARRLCTLVPSPGTDSLRAYDGARLSLFDDRGRFGRRLPVLWPGHRVASVVGVASERVLVETRRFVTSPDGGLARQPSTTKFALLGLESGQVVWEGFFLGAQQYTFVLSEYSVPYFVPFDILPSAAIGMDGFFLTLGEEVGPEIREFDTSGRLRRVIRLDEPTLPPSAEDLDKYTEFQIDRRRVPNDYRERLFEVERSRYQEMSLPNSIPVFSRLLIDETGLLWAELYRFDVLAPARWLVFGPNGEAIGSVDMPPNLQVWQIGQDFVLGVWQDAPAVEYVRRHALAGRKSPS